MELVFHTVLRMGKTTKCIMLDGMYGNAMVFLTKLKLRKMHRFSDQDLMMHYHWGLGVRHHYAHGSGPLL